MGMLLTIQLSKNKQGFFFIQHFHYLFLDVLVRDIINVSKGQHKTQTI